MAEALNALFKAECIRTPVLRGSGWRNLDDVELTVATWTDWYNQRRLHGEIGCVPPTEYETTYWANTMINNYPDNRVLTKAGTT
jgi:transposase InsO family protein